MKIIHVIDQFGLEYGGSSEACYQITKALSKRGHDVYIYPWKIGTLYPQMDVLLIEELPFSWSPDIIHIHNYRSLINIYTRRYARMKKVPYVLQAHGSVGTYFQRGLEKRLFDIVTMGKILRDAYKVIALSDIEISQYIDKQIPESRISLIPNGIDIKQYECLPERGKFRERWGINPNTKVILYLGRIHWMKGLDLLIKSFKSVSGDIKLVIVGSDGNYLKKCKELVANLRLDNRVIFTGWLYDNDKLEAFVDSDLFVLLSSYETFSISALEASICGLPVVASENCGNISCMPSIYPVRRDKVSVSSAIKMILEDESLSTLMSEEGIKITRQLSWDMIAERLEKEVYLK